MQKDEKKDLDLKAASLELPSIIVKTPLKDLLGKQQLGGMELNPDELENMPEFGGESGLIKGLQALPGIATSSDGSAFFFTRGGAKDQNLIIIDDAPIYNPAHLFGFYSIVIPDFSKSIRIYKSDIPVQLGDRLSSIIDIRTKDGNLNKWELTGAFNPLISRFSLEGPLIKGRSSFFISSRQSNFRWIYKNNAPNGVLNFGDFNFKWNVKLNDNNRVYFTLINSRDELANTNTISDNQGGVKWGNFTYTLRWNHLFNPKLFSNFILYYGNYNYRLFFGADAWESGIGKLSAKSDFTYFANPRFTTRFGLELHGFNINPGKITSEPLASLFPTIEQGNNRHVVMYGNADYQLSDKWQVAAGLRFHTWENLGPARYFTFDEQYQVQDTINRGDGVFHTYQKVDPRLSLQYQVDSTATLKLSYGYYHQYVQMISNSVSPFTSLEVWLPASPNIRPQWAQHWTLDFVKYFPRPQMEISAALYYKQLGNQIDYKSHAQTLLNPLIEGELRFGRMRTYGFEFLLKKNFGRLSGWLSYTYSRALRQTPDVNGGREYPAFQDRPHDLSLLLNIQVSRRTLFSAYWTAYTGSAFSSPTGFYTFNHQTVPVYGEKNNDRLPDYRRLDIAFKFTLNKRPESKFQHSLTFSIFNALLHPNIVAVNFNKTLDDTSDPIVRAEFVRERDLVATQADLVRFLPSLTYKFKL